MTANPSVPSRMGRMIVLLSKRQAATARGLAEGLGVSVRTVQRYLRALEAEGLVERRPNKGKGPGRSVLWVWKGAKRDA